MKSFISVEIGNSFRSSNDDFYIVTKIFGQKIYWDYFGNKKIPIKTTTIQLLTLAINEKRLEKL